MNLQQVRKLFIVGNGRADLVNDYPTCAEDNGADFFIQAGQKYLDTKITAPNSRRSYLADVAADDYYVTFKNCRSVEEVWRIDSTGKAQLYPKTRAEFRGLYYYPDLYEYLGLYYDLSLYEETDLGAPTYYTLMQRVAPGLKDAESTDFSNEVTDLLFGKDTEIDGIIFAPISDGNYTIEVSGLWWSNKLEKNDDVSWWSISRPELLAMASNLVLEMFYRNTEGVRDWLNNIEVLMTGMQFDVVRQEAAHSGRLKG